MARLKRMAKRSKGRKPRISLTEQKIRRQGFETRGSRAGKPLRRRRRIGPKLRTTLTPRRKIRRSAFPTLRTTLPARRRRVAGIRRGPLRVTSTPTPRRRLKVKKRR